MKFARLISQLMSAAILVLVAQTSMAQMHQFGPNYGGGPYGRTISFGSNAYVRFVVQLNSNNQVIGGYHRNDYTGRQWNITSGRLSNNRLVVQFTSSDGSWGQCDSQTTNTFVLGPQSVRFTQSADSCGQVSYPGSQFGYQ